VEQLLLEPSDIGFRMGVHRYAIEVYCYITFTNIADNDGTVVPLCRQSVCLDAEPIVIGDDCLNPVVGR
jgi:hypothetical protein